MTIIQFIEKKNKRNAKKRKNIIIEDEKNNNEEIKNEGQLLNQEDNLGKNKGNNNNEIQINDNNKEDKNDNDNLLEKEEVKSNRPILLSIKEDLERKISNLEKDYMLLENKTQAEIEEDFFKFLEIDNNSIYRKKMGGFILPFLIRGKDTRNPEKNVKYPIKFNPKNIRDTYDLLMQRAEDLKKEKELKKMKEKDMQFEKRKKIFSKDLKKLEKDYGERIKKDNYQQIKRSEDNYIKEKNNKLTWQMIQNSDYQTFLIKEDVNKSNTNKKNSFQSNFEDIFTNQSNEIYDEDFLNEIYSNRKQDLNFDESINISRISKNSKKQIKTKNSNLSIESNKRYQLKKKY